MAGVFGVAPPAKLVIAAPLSGMCADASPPRLSRAVSRSMASVARKCHHAVARGMVERCHRAWASSSLKKGGKSSSSSDMARVVSSTNANGVEALGDFTRMGSCGGYG